MHPVKVAFAVYVGISLTIIVTLIALVTNPKKKRMAESFCNCAGPGKMREEKETVLMQTYRDGIFTKSS